MRLSVRPKPRALIAVAASLAAAATPAGTDEWEVNTESVATLAYNSTNIATIWGYHQPMIVRSGERVYCALLEAHGDGFAQHWSLYARDQGGWRRLWSSPRGPQLNQPPSLVADAGGNLHVFAWPDGVFTHWRFASGAGGLAAEPEVVRPPSPYNDLWPYAAAATNTRGDVLVVASSYPRNPWALRAVPTGTWQRGVVADHPLRPDSPSGYDRQAYPFVALAGSQAHVFTTQDIADSTKIAAGSGFVYSFRNLHYFHSPDVATQPFSRTTVIDVEPQGGWVHNDDLLVDHQGMVHLLYQYQPAEGDWPDTRTVHAWGPPGGPFQHTRLGAPGEFNSGRLWESPDGTLYTLQPRFTDLNVLALADDGSLDGTPVDLGLTSTGWGYYGRCFLVGSGSSAGGAPYLEGAYFVVLAEGLSEVRYFRATRRPATAVFGADAPAPQQLRLDPPRPNPCNAGAVIEYRLPEAGTVRIEVRDLLGQAVHTLASGHQQAGSHRVTWDGRDDAGQRAASGVYLVRLQAGGRLCVGKVAVVR